MTDFPRLSRVCRHRLSWRRISRPAAAILLASCAATFAAGCGTSSSTTPQQAVDAAGQQAARITSADATLTEQVGGAAGETISGTIVERLKPTLLLSMTLGVSAGGTSETLGGIVNTKAIYLHSPQFTRLTGKTWIELPFSLLGGSNSSLAQLFKSLSKINPAQQAAVFAGARNVREVGTQVIDGVQTTHYTGTIPPRAALAALPPGLRKALAPGLKTITGDIRFNIWVDSQNHIRKLLDVETVLGQPVTTTIVFSAINQPVHVTLPPPSQVASIPASALGGSAA